MLHEDSLSEVIKKQINKIHSKAFRALLPVEIIREDLEFPDFSISLNTKRSEYIHSKFSSPLRGIDFINIKSLIDLNIDTSELNLLAGKNSSGKSSIIESIALISKWLNSSNFNYNGVPFGKDFNALSFKEFKSNNTESEPTIIKFKYNNMLDGEELYFDTPDFPIGDFDISFELGTFENEDNNKEIEELRYAPIKRLDIKINQNSVGEGRNTSKLRAGFTPITAHFKLENQINYQVFNEILYSQKIFVNHLNSAPRHHIFIGMHENMFLDAQPQIIDFKANPVFDFDLNIYESINEDLQKVKQQKDSVKSKIYPRTLKQLQEISSNLDFSISSVSNNDSKYTKVYGVSFDASSKEIKHFSKSLNGWTPVNKRVLIKWLALDYMIASTKQFIPVDAYLPDDSEKKDNLTFDRNYEFNENLNYEMVLYSKDKLIESDVWKKVKKDFPDLSDEELFMKTGVDGKIIVNHSAREFLFHLKIALKEGLTFLVSKSKKESSSRYVYNSLLANFKSENLNSNTHPVLAWLREDTTLFNEFKEKIVNNFTSVSGRGIGLLNLPKTFLDETEAAMENTFKLLDCLSTNLVNNCEKKINENKDNPLEDIYLEIDKELQKNKNLLPIFLEWDGEKYKILEFLSEANLTQDNLLAPLLSKFELKENLESIRKFRALMQAGEGNEERKPTAHDDRLLSKTPFTEKLSKNFKQSLNSTLARTIFIGPLRERNITNDDIFSYNYPFLLGKNGELSGNFLGTFGDNIIEFPTPSYFEGSSDLIQTESKSYFEHLSDWLNHIGIANEVKITQKGLLINQEGRDLQLQNVGVGVSQVLPVLLAAMISDDDIREKQTGIKDILLLEQPALHLHPSAQANLGDFFIASTLEHNKTIFIETHSEHIVNRIKTRKIELENIYPEKINIFFAMKNEGKTNLIEMKIAKDGSYDVDEYPDGFFDEAQKEAYSLYEKNLKKS